MQPDDVEQDLVGISGLAHVGHVGAECSPIHIDLAKNRIELAQKLVALREEAYLTCLVQPLNAGESGRRQYAIGLSADGNRGDLATSADVGSEKPSDVVHSDVAKHRSQQFV